VASGRGALICCGLTAGLLVGCPRSHPAVVPSEDGGVPVVRPSGLLQVPSGWTVVTAGDGTLRVSDSPGHAVLRAELRSGMGLPTPETMRSGFTEGLRRWKLRRSQSVEEPGYVSVRLVVAEPGDAGSEQEVLLSATALGTDTLLCASLRGASDAALEAIERICRSAGDHRDAGQGS
jgi:hypothetical protein